MIFVDKDSSGHSQDQILEAVADDSSSVTTPKTPIDLSKHRESLNKMFEKWCNTGRSVQYTYLN